MARLVPVHRRALFLPVAGALLRLAAPAGAATAPGADQVAASPTPLTRIAEIKSSAELADRSLPVELEGVVTWAASAGNFFLQEGALGIHVGSSDVGKRLQPGDRVRVSGITRRGAFAPSVEPRQVVVVGQGALPEPRRPSWNEVAAGSLDGQWLEMEGVVGDVEFEAATLGSVFHLSVEGRRLRATVNHAEAVDPDRFVDARVRLRGVASGRFNPQRQLLEPELRVPGMAYVTMVRPPPADPFAVAPLPLTRLLGFSLAPPSPHRVRIAGVVTRRMSDRVLFIRDGGRGLKIETREAVSHAPGEAIEAVGFPALLRGAAVLTNAMTRVTGVGAAPPPVDVQPAQLVDGAYYADLVRVAARLVDRVVTRDEETLILQAGNQLFQATLPGATQDGSRPELDSVVEVTGICVLGPLEEGPGDAFRTVGLLLSSPSDLVVRQPPDWWTSQRLWRALAIAGVLLVLGLGWIWSLRAQVRRKRAVIEQQARHAAVLEERSRIARDLHDTLEQELTGLSLQLKVAEMDCREAPHQVGVELEVARRMLRRSRALAHNAIRELRTDDVARRDEPIGAGLQRIVQTWQHSGLEGVTLTIEGNAIPLPGETTRHLLAIAGEAITNAVKHGQATAIEVRVIFGAAGLRLAVRDNGAGFDATRASAAGGSFGLVGMRERAAAIGANLELQSTADAGTLLTVDVAASARPGDSTPLVQTRSTRSPAATP